MSTSFVSAHRDGRVDVVEGHGQGGVGCRRVEVARHRLQRFRVQQAGVQKVGVQEAEEQLLRRIVKRFRGGLVFKTHGLLYHSTLGSRVLKKKRKRVDVVWRRLWRSGVQGLEVGVGGLCVCV